MAFLDITYNDGGSPLDYKSVNLTYDKNGIEVKQQFNTGNFVKDWYDYMKTVAHFDDNFFDENYTIMYSSSVDHFIYDSDLFEIKYMKVKADGSIIFTKRRSSGGIKFYINKGSNPTWDEMKQQNDDRFIKEIV